MNRHKVESSNIESMGWEDGVLEVEFKKGEVYQYQGVPEYLYLQVLYATSIGKAFASQIQNDFEGQKV